MESVLLTYDKKIKKADITQISKKDKSKKVFSLDLSKANLSEPVQPVSSFLTASQTITSVRILISSGGEGWWGHRYNIYKEGSSSYYWHLKQSSTIYKNLYENLSNTGTLHSYKTAIDTAQSNEIGATTAVGAAVAGAVAGALGALQTVGIAAIIGLLVLFGGTVTAAVYFYNAWQACRDADYYFARV